MAAVTTASNIGNIVGKWVPYYFKPFLLGRATDGVGSTDGETYITKTVGDATVVSCNGFCNSSANCNFYYTLTFDYVNASFQYFYVDKYDLNDNHIETIVASDTSGGGADGTWWKHVMRATISIDIGVNIGFPNGGEFDDGDVYKLTLPSADTMDRRKIYHGGYSSFLRMPETEDKTYHSDIIPTNLKGKNITVSFNAKTGMFPTATQYLGLYLSSSKERFSGNASVSLALEWNVDEDSATSNTAGTVTFGWNNAETWQLGSIFASDVDPASDDTPLINSFPASDVTPVVPTTGAVQVINATSSGRAGKARMRTEFSTGSGTARITAFNQFWLAILTIS